MREVITGKDLSNIYQWYCRRNRKPHGVLQSGALYLLANNLVVAQWKANRNRDYMLSILRDMQQIRRTS